jgi:hypothetical protein
MALSGIEGSRMTDTGWHQNAAVFVTLFIAPRLPLKGRTGLEADHRVVDLCAAISSAEPFAT